MDHSITSLIEKLEEAEVGSVELDALINLHFHRDREHLWSLSGMNAQRASWKEDDLNKVVLGSPTEYGLECPVSTNLDDAIALAERVLQPMPWTVSRFHRKGTVEYQAAFWLDPEREPTGKGRANSPALAVVIAILRAQSEARV